MKTTIIIFMTHVTLLYSGTDFDVKNIAVLYEQGPSYSHASYVVLVASDTSNMGWQRLITANRIAEATRKVWFSFVANIDGYAAPSYSIIL